ncbi:filamentous hemagglutinin N-terminal domain-containing protein [Yersinia intermedia]|uniref:two-partner secretion domain-containing protein n=1 Tax=Yersinia intermedia TaxID=631 RepID=UPI0022FEDDEE|nr:filamentous hemagglutinin N-terminal domain-containing protein [Yersinia intermedia]MDA5480694.1 filamentous hemagglutinin N-terminal domain-containing protein [Yersinia intermedia]
MNSKLYKLIFCRRLGCLIAVGEFTRAYGRSFSSIGKKVINDSNTKAGILSHLAIMTGLALGTLPLLVFAHPSLPVNGNIVIGQGRLEVHNTTLTVTQQSDKLAINWGSFDIAQGNSVIYNQPGQQSIALNRVLGRDASQIYGNLKANGQVFLLNPNGILFGRGAQVDVGGLVASTKAMSNNDFISGTYTLTSRRHEGKLVNQANLHTTKGGYIALIGQQVDNQSSGVINTPQGKVAFASGSRVTLHLDHGSLLGVQVQGEQVSALLQNGGLIQADGGVIQLTARGKEMLMNTVIDNTGILQARGLSEKNGVIYLDGGSEGVVRQQGIVDASSQYGRGGSVILQGENVHLAAGSKIDAHGAEGGGKVLVGGGWQGKNNAIKNSRSVVMDKGAVIDVSALGQGAGGIAVLWSESYTGFYGDIHARGGLQSGNGGQVETSSKRNLQAFGHVDASATAGSNGSWLLDPAEVNIVGSGAQSGSSVQAGDIPAGYGVNAQVFMPTANVAQILNSSINTQLDLGTNVTVTTNNNSLTNCRWCNITLDADINKTAGGDATLTLHADGNIVINNNISTRAAKLNLNLLAGNSTADSVITLNNVDVLLNNGDLLAKHADDKSATRIAIQGGRYEVGNLTLEGNAAVASHIGVSISNAANISVAGETRITGESSNANGQGWRGVDMSEDSILTGVGNILFALKSNSKISWMGTFANVTIIGDKDITFQANANGSTYGGVDIVNGNISSKSGNILFDVNGDILTQANYGLRIRDSQVGGGNVNFGINVTGVDGLLFRDGDLTATAGDINVNATTTNKGIWISGNTNVNASGDINLQGMTSNSTYAGADAIKISGNSSSVQVNMTAGGNISMVAVNEGTEIGTTVVADFANIKAESGDFNLNISGVKGSPFNNVSISADNILMNGNIINNEAVLMTNTVLTAKKDIKTNLTSATHKAFRFSGNGAMTAGQDILLVTNTSAPSVEAITINGTSSNRINITAGKEISITANNHGNTSGAGVGIDGANIEAKSGNFTINNNGSKGITWTNVDLTANEVNFASNSTSSAGVAIRESNITATTGDINANVTSQKEGILIKPNTIFNAKKDINLTGVATGDGEGIVIQGDSNTSRNNLIAQGNITLNGKADTGDATRPSVYLSNTTLTATEHNIDINGLSAGARNVYFTDVELNAIAGNVAVYSETQAALPTPLSTALSLGGNITIKAKNGSMIGKAFDTTQGSGIGFRANSTLSVEGNIAFQGETEGSGATRKGIDFNGANTLNIAKDSQLSFLGQNKGAQVIVGGEGITYADAAQLTINNNGSLKMEGRSTRGVGINFSTNNNSVVLSGEGDTLIKGSSVADTGVAISGVVNNGTGPITIEGTSRDNIGVHLFSAEHQVNRINVTGNSTHADGLRISGNATITDATLTGASINGSGVKIDPLPGSNIVTHVVLDNATLTGSSTNGIGVEVANDIKGIHQSVINGTTNGTGYGIEIAANLHVTGTSETDLLTLNGVATTDIGTGIKLNGNNDLSNTSLNGSAVDGIALDITSSSANQGNTVFKGTASGSGIGVQINGLLDGGVVNGAATSGTGVQVIDGVLDNSRINGLSDAGSGVSVNGDTVLNNTVLVGNSTDGKGVEIVGRLSGGYGSSVQGDVVNGIGMYIDRNATLTGGDSGELLVISGNATGEKGIGVQLEGNNTLDNTMLNGNATQGTGVDITGPLVNNGNTRVVGIATGGNGVALNGAIAGGTVSGTSDSGTGVNVDGDTQLNTTLLNGNSSDGKGVEIAGNLTGSNGSAVHGDTTNGTGVDVNRDTRLIGGGLGDLLNVTGNATGEKGTGIQFDGINILDNTSLAGNATNGTGVDINGLLQNEGNTTIAGQSENGNGIQLEGAVSGGTVTGTSANGSGIKVVNDSNLDNATLNGNSPDGKGVEIAGNLTGSNGSAVHGDTTNGTGVDIGKQIILGGGLDDLLNVTGNATGENGTGVQFNGINILDNTLLTGNATNGTGVDINGLLQNEGNTTIGGQSDNGSGVQLGGAVSGGSVNGTSANGSGIKVVNDSNLDNAILNGNSLNGKGVEIAGNLTGSNGSAVQGETTNGSGVDVGENASLSGMGPDDLLTVTGNASGDKGAGVQLDGNNTLNDTTLAGNAIDGHGVAITGPVSNTGNTTINGNTANDGHAVHVGGPISGGRVNGNSVNNHAIFLDDDAAVTNIELSGNTGSNRSPVFITLPTNIGENVTINGKPIDKNSFGGKSIERTSLEQITPPEEGIEPGLLLMKRNQILNSLETQTLPPPIVTESEHDIAANISIAVCIPEGVPSQKAPCDTYIVGKWKPLPKISGQE